MEIAHVLFSDIISMVKHRNCTYFHTYIRHVNIQHHVFFF